MNSSPASLASSSDLYPNSEPAGESQANPLQTQSPGRERIQLGFEGPQPDGGTVAQSWSGDTKVPPGLQKHEHEEVQASSEIGTRASGTFDGSPSHESHKRKREDDAENFGFIQGKPSYQVLVENLPDLPKVANSDSLKNGFPISKNGTSSNNLSFNKRTKPNDINSKSTLKTSISCQLPSLPAKLWQYIFCFVAPISLGRLLRVNHAFNACLTQSDFNKQDVKQTIHSIAKPLNPETVWASSRKRFCPGLPKPMRGLNELDMWKLFRGHNCQVCGELKASSPVLKSENPWESGPGEVGVRIIWPWGVRICGQCIQKHSEKEVDLLFSSLSALLPALPFAFISISNHYITSSALRNSTPPPTLQLKKYFYKPHIEEIRQRLDHAKGLGNASAEEWVKGLDSEGKERLNEVTRWEQWEAKGGLRKVNLRPHPRTIIPPGSTATRLKANQIKSEDTKSESTKQDIPGTEHARNEDSKKDNLQYDHIKNGLHSDRSTPQGARFPVKVNRESNSPNSSTAIITPYLPPTTTLSFQPSWTSSAPHSENLPPHQQATFLPLRYERNIRDVNEAKANRKAEIERRCAALNPPLTPKVLAHMDTFQAAIQISQPLTDQAWHVLKPRLLTQRAYAERREKEVFEQGQQLKAEYEQRRYQEAQLKETKESLDREWDNVQMPIRNQIARLADERIERKWFSGKAVTKDNSPQFAADVLLYVRKSFYDETTQEEESAITTRRPSRFDARPPSRILILENMKWVFDTKIKPFTENFQKELFLCNGCDGNFKFYGLESVVQHYAAKHTTTLSCGPQVVSWRAEWPEHPLFHPKPSVAQADYYKIPPPLTSSSQTPLYRDSESSSHFGGYGQTLNPLTQATSHFLPASGKDSYVQQQQQNGHSSSFENQSYFRSSLHATTKPYDFPQSSDLGIHYPGSYTSNNGFRSPSVPAAQVSNYQALAYSNLEPSQSNDPKTRTWHETESSAVISHPARPSTSFSQYPAADGDHFRQTTGVYQFQLDEMARHARDVWSATSGIKDIPQSVRIYVVIQQMATRFTTTFLNEPSIGMFLDILDHNALMRPIRNQKGLACKVCVTSGNDAGRPQSSYEQLAVENRWLYHLPQLLNHFKTAHLDSIQSNTDPMISIECQTLDWKNDMIELPESHLIAALINAPGMDDVKLELIARVFPGVFPSPLPKIGATGNTGPVPIFPIGFDRGRPSQGMTPETYPDSPSRMEPRSEIQLFNRPYSGFRESSQPARSSEPPGEDEYDPHRPAFLGKIVPSGISLPHIRKPSRNTPTRNSESSLLRSKHDGYPYMRLTVTDRPPATYNGPPHRGAIGDNRIDQHNEKSDGAQRSISPERHVQSLSRSRFNHEPPSSRKQHSLKEPNVHDKVVDVNVNHGHISEDGQVKDSSIFLNPRGRALSPGEGISEADEFLDNLGTISNLDSRLNFVPCDHEEYQATSQPQELPQDLHPQIQPDMATETPDWRINVHRRGRDNDLPNTPARIDSSKVKKYDELVMPQKSTSNHEQDVNYRSMSDLHRPLNEGLVARRSPDLHTTYETPRKFAQDRYEVGEAIMEVSRPGDGSFHVTRTSQYRSRSRSPRPLPIGTTYYRARTPINEGRLHNSAYHIYSPPLRTDILPQRIISHEYPTQGYEYVDDRRPSDNTIRQRVEYVPVRVEEHTALEPGRFVIAQPVGMRPQPDYVQLDRGYNGEPVYERHSQLYHANPRPYYAPQGHSASAFAQGYRY